MGKEQTAKALARVARQLHADKTERDRLIVQMRSEGGTLREIAEVAGVTHAGVQRIVVRVGAAAHDE